MEFVFYKHKIVGTRVYIFAKVAGFYGWYELTPVEIPESVIELDKPEQEN